MEPVAKQITILESELNELDLDADNELNHEDLHKMAQSLRERFEQLEELNDIEKAIEYENRAIKSTPEGHSDLPSRHGSLGISYTYRFWRLNDLNDLEKAIEHESRALELTPEGHPNLLDRYENLGISYNDRFLNVGDWDDLEKAIEYKCRALALTPEGHPDLSRRHTELGVIYSQRFQRLGEVVDLGRAIEHKSQALVLTPDSHPDLALQHSELGSDYTNRFVRSGDLDDLERMFKHQLRALELTPDDHPDLPSWHGRLATSYIHRFRRLDDLGDLDQAIKHASRALVLIPENHPDLPSRHSSLGICYTYRFRRLDDLDDLEKAIEHEYRALTLTPEDHPDFPSRHANLGLSYSFRSLRLNELGDLEKSIEYGSRALALTPNDHPDLSLRLAELAASYTTRFLRLGDLDDLEKSIEHASRALALTPEGHQDLPNRHAELGVAYTARFRRLEDLDDLHNAIKHDSHALALVPEGHPDLSIRHANLGISYADRFRHLGDLNDLEQAVQHGSRALALAPENHADSSYQHAELGRAYSDRYRRLGDSSDLEKAIEHESHALALTPEGHPDLPARHSTLGLTLFSQYQHTGDPSHLNDSLDSFRKGSRLSTGPPLHKFRCALDWTRLASIHASLERIEAYQTAIDLLPQFAWLGATAIQRYSDLVTAEGLAVNAASTAILHSNYELALEWLEHARCVVWNQSLMLRNPVDQLQSSHPDLAAYLKVISEQLNSTSFGSPASGVLSQPLSPEQIGQERRRLAKEHESLLAQIRSISGFKDFLLPMKTSQLADAAKTGPIATIVCHVSRCDVLVILPGKNDITHLSLPSFTQDKARRARSELESALRRKGIRERGVKARERSGSRHDIGNVLAELWRHIVKPVLNFLGYIDDPPDDLPHLTWCPTGPISFLPLHAAGDYDQPGSRVFDYVISSYTPTLTALLASTPTSLDRPPRVLAIGQAHTPGRSPLPGTIKELACVKAHTQNRAEYAELNGNQATTTDVLNAMERHDWVHLACHANQNVSNPTKSGFHLHDGTLDLTSINLRSFRNKGLAFLSACQTATGDERLPDEAIHLASGMLMAGYPSVIATMWSVSDSDAPLIADKVYAELMKDGKVGNGEAGKALHDAVAVLRDQVGEKSFVRWVPYIHIGS